VADQDLETHITMTDGRWPPPSPPPPSRPPAPPQGGSGSVATPLIALGVVLLLPGMCAIYEIILDPTVLSPGHRNATQAWEYLAVGVGGVAMIAAAIILRRRVGRRP